MSDNTGDARFFDFDAIRAAKAEVNAGIKRLSFTLGGVTFTCVRAPKATRVGDLVAAAGNDIHATITYLASLVIKSQRDEFLAVLEDDELDFDLEDLGTIINKLSEAYAARPTEPSSV